MGSGKLGFVCLCVAVVSAINVESACGQTDDFDVLIQRALIVDGTGNPAFQGDVAIAGDKIAMMGRALDVRAKRVIDASGLVMAPGFIDIHSHSDTLLLEDGAAHSKIRQGVTTDVLGEGESAGPNKGPRQSEANGKSRTAPWPTLGAYFSAVERAGISINIASYVGLNNIWQSAMGNSFERPSDQQFVQMEQTLTEAMQDGALGLSSYLMMPPGSLATTEDLVRLCKVVAQHGGIYSSHIRTEGIGVVEAVKEAIAIGQRAKVPVDIIHLKIADEKLWGQMSQLIALIAEARTRGVNVQANVYPYTRGNNNLASIIPPWAHEGGTAKMLERLRDPEQRKRIKHDVLNGIDGWYNHYTAVGGDWSRMQVAAENRFKGLTMDRVMDLRTAGKSGADRLDEMFDFLLEEAGSVSTVFAHHTESDMNLAMIQPWCSIGSDGSAYAVTGPLRRGNPHPRSFGTFPRVLGEYVREQKLLSLEDAVRKMTSLNAAKIGLMDRGLIRSGMAADVILFDAGRIRDLATYTEPFQYSTGVEYVLVNGVVVLEGSNHTGATPGRALRKHPKALHNKK